MIGTAIHKAIEDGDLDQRTWLRAACVLPTFVVDWDLHKMFNDQSAQDTVEALCEADLMHLPYPTMVIELWGTLSHRYFVVLNEKGKRHYMASMVHWSSEQKNVVGPYYATLKYSNDEIHRGLWEMSHNVDLRIVGKEFYDSATKALGVAAELAVLFTHIGGLERTAITPDAKLNKARVKRGNPPIPTHTRVSIGHYYDRSGNAHSASGRHVSIHMRAGHVRSQRHGPKNSLTKKVWIAPVLVNYKDGTDLSVPKPKIVTK